MGVNYDNPKKSEVFMPFINRNTLFFKIRRPHLFDIDNYLITDKYFTAPSNDEPMSESPEFDKLSIGTVKRSQIPKKTITPSNK